MALKHSYTVLAPVYDWLVSSPLNPARQNSLARLGDVTDKHILINGIGTGLDIPLLPVGAHYIGSDITPAMLNIAKKRAQNCDIELRLQQADSMALPFDDQQFDIIIMHLILAVVPDPVAALRQAERVLKPGGRILIYDKFLKPGEHAPVRRLLNLITRHIATRTDVVFEQVLSQTPKLTVTQDEPALAGGWFRLIELQKSNS